jgi:hypothetical protein
MTRPVVGACIVLLSTAGCWHEELHQAEVCVPPLLDAGATSTASCPSREQASSYSYVRGSTECPHGGDPLVSIDDGPVLTANPYNPGEQECCYLATYRRKFCLPE